MGIWLRLLNCKLYVISADLGVVTFLHSENGIGSFLLCKQDAATCILLEVLAVLTRHTLGNWYSTSKASNKLRVGWPDTHASLLYIKELSKCRLCFKG
jgi:hypothetical protein